MYEKYLYKIPPNSYPCRPNLDGGRCKEERSLAREYFIRVATYYTWWHTFMPLRLKKAHLTERIGLPFDYILA